MVIYNLDQNQFQIYTNQEYFLAIQIDQKRTDFKEVIHLFDKLSPGEVIPLNNEGDESLELCLELFTNENKDFIMLLDYYRFDNKQKIAEIFELQ